jgi:hypothetical protein
MMLRMAEWRDGTNLIIGNIFEPVLVEHGKLLTFKYVMRQ